MNRPPPDCQIYITQRITFPIPPECYQAFAEILFGNPKSIYTGKEIKMLEECSRNSNYSRKARQCFEQAKHILQLVITLEGEIPTLVVEYELVELYVSWSTAEPAYNFYSTFPVICPPEQIENNVISATIHPGICVLSHISPSVPNALYPVISEDGDKFFPNNWHATLSPAIISLAEKYAAWPLGKHIQIFADLLHMINNCFHPHLTVLILRKFHQDYYFENDSWNGLENWDKLQKCHSAIVQFLEDHPPQYKM